MKHHVNSYAVVACLLLSACGGSSGDAAVTPPPPPPPPPPPVVAKVSLQITSADLQLSGLQGDALPVSFTGNWDAKDLGTNAVFVRALDESKNVIAASTQDVTTSKSFTLKTTTNHKLAEGSHSSTISLVACKDIDCKNLYENAAGTVKLQLSLAAVPAWQTHQANAAHNAYVPIWVATDNFSQLWQWKRPPSSEPIGGINAPVAGKGHVYLSTDVYHGDAAVVALNELTGKEVWRVSFGVMPALNSPAISQDSLFVATSGHQDTKLWGINRADGKLKFQANFSSQWGNYLAPIVDKDLVFQTGGYYGGDLTAFSAVDGRKVWEKSSATSWGMDSAAADENHVYTHDGAKLSIFNKADGSLVASIKDPFGNSNYDYHGAPAVGSQGQILAFSGGAFSGRASSNVEHYESRVISAFDIAKRQYNWTSQFSYQTFFAVANGVVYAAKNNPVALDAIDEKTGAVLWSWTAPSTKDTSFHRNVVVTKNLLFVSTNAHIYAVDLTTKSSVWSYPEPGTIAISDNRILLLATGARESDGRLIAFDLRSK